MSIFAHSFSSTENRSFLLISNYETNSITERRRQASIIISYNKMVKRPDNK